MKRTVITLVGLAALGLGFPASASTPPSTPPDGDQDVTVEDLAAAQVSFVGAAETAEYTGLADVACTIREELAVCYATLATGAIRGDAEWTSDKPAWEFVEFAPAEAGAGTPTGEQGTRDNPTPIGVAAPVGNGWTAVVNSVELDATDAVMAANEFNSPPVAGSQYVVANITITYDGRDASDGAGVNFQALGASNVTLDSGGSSYAVPATPLETFTEVFQGGSLTGDVLFEVPTEDVGSLVIIGHAYMSFDDEDRSFFATT